jgi:hypothetical protein
MSLKFKQFKWADIKFDEIETIESTEPGQPRIYKTPVGDFPSMTSILSILDDGGLDGWIARVGKEEADRICQEAADRGNELHDINELYLRNELTRDMIKGQGGILFNRVKKYLDEIELVVACEVALYSKELKYAGRTDCIGVIDDKLMIIDHKNSRREIDLSKPYARKKIFGYMVQITGYKKALLEMTGLDATHGCLIVGNHINSTASRFIFEIDDLLLDELEKIANFYSTGIINREELNFFQIGKSNENFPRILS